MKIMLRIAMWVYLTLIAAACLLAFYWLFWPQNPYTKNTKYMEIATPIVKRGGYVQYWVSATHNTKGMAVDVSTQLIDGIVIQYQPRNYLTVPGKHRFLITQKLPDFLPTGLYKFSTVTTFHINPLRDIPVSWDSQSFTVVD